VRAAILFILCVGMATAASAGVGSADVAGFPRFVDVWKPGVYSVSSTQTVELWDNGNLAGQFFEADVFGTFLSPSGCFAAAKNDGTLVSTGNCVRSGNISPGDPTATTPDVRRVRGTSSGTGYAMVRLESTRLQLLTTLPANTGEPSWSALTVDNPSYLPTSVMGVTETNGGVPHALFHVLAGPGDFLWYRERDPVAEVVIASNLSQVPPATVDLFATEGPNPVAIYGSDAGLFRGELTPPPVPGLIDPFSPVTILDGGTRVRIVSVDVNTGQGSARGEGYGVAVGLGDSNEFVLLGAVPADSAADAGTLWRINPKVDTSSLPAPLEVGCAGSEFCVISLDSPGEGSGNLRLYTNEDPPRFVSGTQQPVVLDEGGGPVPLRVTATDDDGDAVRVSVDSAAAADLFEVRAGLQPDTLDLQITPRGVDVCKTETRVLKVFASDGLGSHDQAADVSVTLNNVRGPEVPGVTPRDAGVVAGETQGVVFTATPPGSGPCATVGYRWTSAPELAVSPDGTATFTPPPSLCDAQGTRYTYNVQGLDEGGLASAPTPFSVYVAPWGPPLPPFGSGAVRALASGPGSGTDVTPEAPLHTCTGTPGLPGVQTVWRLSDSSAGVPVAFTVRDADGGTVSLESPVVSPRLRVEAAACTRASLSFTAFNRIQTDAGVVQDSPEATVRVDAVPAVEDITAAQLLLTAVPAEQGQVDIQLGTSVLCPAEYALKAQLSLRDLDGGTLADAVVDVPGSWRPPLPDACSARDYIVHGELFDESTGTRRNGGTAQTQVSAQALPAALGALEGEALVAHCGERATATLTQTIPANACQAVDITWRQVGGPALAEAELGGAQVTVATRDTGLEGLVGESVVLSVTADAGGGNSTTTQHVVPITTTPFVDVAHETESPAGSETGLVGVVVQLRNTSECQVGSLRHVEQVDGLDWVPGSVKVDGRPVAEQAVEGGFVVDGVTLPAGGTSALTYVARPRLLASPRFGGEMFLNGVLVSGTVPAPPSSGCGCSSGDAGSALLGLLALARLLRRRRDGAAG
jgi:MYXO-CTERM domain-containing protein